jgi:hypothetical protein
VEGVGTTSSHILAFKNIAPEGGLNGALPKSIRWDQPRTSDGSLMYAPRHVFGEHEILAAANGGLEALPLNDKDGLQRTIVKSAEQFGA